MKHSIEGLIVGFFFGIFISAGLIFIGDFYTRLAGFILTVLIGLTIWGITAVVESWMKSNEILDIEFKPSTWGFLIGFVGPFMGLAYTYVNKITGIAPLVLYMLLTLFSLIGFLAGVYIEQKEKRASARKKKK